MASHVEFKDFSIQVNEALNDITINWLDETSYEILTHAAENCQMTKEDKGQLRSMYRRELDEENGIAHVGSELESSYWEEFGTGSYADTTKNGGKQGRQGWWIYSPGNPGPVGGKSNEYQTKEEAEQMAAFIRAKYNKEAVVTNGRQPNYTLEKAFESTRNPAISRLKQQLKERMEK